MTEVTRMHGTFFKKAGTTTISATVNGTKISTKFTVKKYSSPVKSFKVGKTSFASKYKTYDEFTWYHTGKVSGKTFSVAANSGWKISDVYLNYSHVFNAYYVSDLKSSYKTKVTMNGTSDSIEVRFYNTKTKLTESIVLKGRKE